jgi:hypothetical protein
LEFAKKYLSSYKVIDWGVEELSLLGLQDILPLGERKVVPIIYDRIKKLEDTNFILKINKEVINEKYIVQAPEIKYDGNGTNQVYKELERLVKNDKKRK